MLNVKLQFQPPQPQLCYTKKWGHLFTTSFSLGLICWKSFLGIHLIWVQVFSLILDSSVGLSAGIQCAGDLVSETLMSWNPAFSRGRQLVSFRFEYRLPVPEHHN